MRKNRGVGGYPWYDQSFHFGNPLASTDLRFPFFLSARRLPRPGRGVRRPPRPGRHGESFFRRLSPLANRLPAAASAEEGHWFRSFRTIGNRCPTSRTRSHIYHYIKYPCRRADIFVFPSRVTSHKPRFTPPRGGANFRSRLSLVVHTPLYAEVPRIQEHAYE